MPLSPRMKWPIPTEGQDPWFEAFCNTVKAIDTSTFATREDRGLVIMEGGNVSFSASTNSVSWDAAIELLASVTGFTWNLDVQAVTLRDGDIMYVELSRSPTQVVTVTPKVASQIPSTDDAFFLCIRRGSKINWRDGFVLLDGVTTELFQSSGVGLDIATGDARYVNVIGDTMTGNLRLNDNLCTEFGTAGDATICYDTTHLVINPRAVGSGQLYIGNASTSATPQIGEINATGGLGSNIDGAALHVAGGQGTGTGAGGSVLIRTAPAGGAGASPNALVTRIEISEIGEIGINGSFGTVGQVLKSGGVGVAASWDTDAVTHEIPANTETAIINETTTGNYLTANDTTSFERLVLMKNDVRRVVEIGDSSSIVDIDPILNFHGGNGGTSNDAAVMLDGSVPAFQIQINGINCFYAATNNDQLAVGHGATATGENGTAIGDGSSAGSTNTIAIGEQSTAPFANSIALGAQAQTDGVNSMSVGSAASEIINYYFGRGWMDATPPNTNFYATNATATNNAGDFTTNGGQGGAASGATPGGAGGIAAVKGGNGGAGNGSAAGGAGAAVNITAGTAGADGGGGGANGGAVTITGGAGTGAGVDGDVNIGTASTVVVNIGAATINTEIGGILNVDGLTTTLNSDGVAGTGEDPVLAMLGGDGGSELIASTWQQLSAVDAMYLTTRLSTVTQGSSDRTTFLGIGPANGSNATGDVIYGWLQLVGHISGDATTNLLKSDIYVDPTVNELLLFAPQKSFDGAPSGGIRIELSDNRANALIIEETSREYLNINTTNTSEKMTFGNATVNNDYQFLGSGEFQDSTGSAGTATWLWTSNGAAAAPSWQAAAPGILPHTITANTVAPIVDEATTGNYIVADDSTGAELLELMGNDVSRDVHIGDATSIVNLDPSLYWNAGTTAATRQARMWYDGSADEFFLTTNTAASALSIKQSQLLMGIGATSNSNSACYGHASTCVGTNSVLLGNNSNISSGCTDAILIGYLSGMAGTADRSILIGASAGSGNVGANAIAMGFDVVMAHDACFVAGRAATSTSANQGIFGSETYPISDYFLGQGFESTTDASAVSINASSATGTSINGANLTIAAGAATGVAQSGVLNLQVSCGVPAATTLHTDRIFLQLLPNIENVDTDGHIRINTSNVNRTDDGTRYQGQGHINAAVDGQTYTIPVHTVNDADGYAEVIVHGKTADGDTAVHKKWARWKNAAGTLAITASGDIVAENTDAGFDGTPVLALTATGDQIDCDVDGDSVSATSWEIDWMIIGNCTDLT